MSTMSVNTTGVHDATWQWPIAYEPLLLTLREAARRAAQLQRSVLASFTQPIEWYDTIRVFSGSRLAELGECFFWERPAEQNALVGVGAATTIETRGSTYVTDAASAWRALLNDAVVTYAPEVIPTYGTGPVLFGGFAFDPLQPRTQLWNAFPDGLLILPRLLLSYDAGRVALTVNKVIQASDDIEFCAREIAASVRRLFSAVERTPPFPTEDKAGTGCQLSVQDLRSETEWMNLVAHTVDMIQRGAYEKVVLARGVEVTRAASRGAFDISATLHRLRKSYPGTYVFAMQRGNHFFVGATPERLVQAQDGQIRTMALAGSAARGASEEEDVQLGMELLESEKNNAEHALVVAMVHEALMTHCTEVHVAARPHLLKLKNVQHLQTPIIGELIPGRCILDVMANLHPTPAVGGFPRQDALEAIRSTEQLDRGWYAGPLGWIGVSGHGEFAVALRSGLINDSKATLFAGCGIVANSDPQSEFAESCLKLQVMLRGLGGTN